MTDTLPPETLRALTGTVQPKRMCDWLTACGDDNG